jgi:hypothetical protein
LRDILELNAISDGLEQWILRPTIDWLRTAGWTDVHLFPHWAQVFTIFWMYLLAFARAVATVPPGRYVLSGWAMLCAFIGAALAGLVSLEDRAIVPALAFCSILFAVVGLHFRADFSSRRKRLMSLTALLLAVVILAVYGSDLGHPVTEDYGANPLVVVAQVMIALAAYNLLAGIWLVRSESWQNRLSNPAVAFGLDVSGVVGLAFAIGYAMRI